MRVLLDTTFARRAPFSGTAVYLERIAGALSETGAVELIEVVNERRRAPGGGGPGSLRNLIADWWWTAVTLPRRAQDSGADLIHHPLPAHARAPRIPQVITVHDLAFERFPGHFDRGYRAFASRSHRRAAKGAARVICVSETTARDVQELWGVPRERIVVALHGPGQALAAVPRNEAPAHFLYVGDDEPRKRVSVLLAAYEHYRELTDVPLALVLAGGVQRAAPGIRIERNPSRERLAALYSGAIALLHPSSHEGFGMTVLEAMSLGTPVLAAPSPAIVEVCGEAARYADPQDTTAFAAAMAELEASPTLRG